MSAGPYPISYTSTLRTCYLAYSSTVTRRLTCETVTARISGPHHWFGLHDLDACGLSALDRCFVYSRCVIGHTS